VLQLSACVALEAFFALPGSSAPSFRTVVQGATETYSNIIDQLYNVLMNHQDLNDETKQQMFHVLAFDNANKTTKHLLAGLPRGAGAEDMLSRVERAGEQKQQATVAAAMQGTVRDVVQPLAAAVQQNSPLQVQSSVRRICYRRGAKGHIRRCCRGSVWCEKCQKDTHATKVCSGNERRIADRGHVWKQMNPPNKVRVFHNSLKPQQEAAWESTWQPQ